MGINRAKSNRGTLVAGDRRKKRIRIVLKTRKKNTMERRGVCNLASTAIVWNSWDLLHNKNNNNIKERKEKAERYSIIFHEPRDIDRHGRGAFLAHHKDNARCVMIRHLEGERE